MTSCSRPDRFVGLGIPGSDGAVWQQGSERVALQLRPLSYTHSRRFSLRFGASANRFQVLNGQGTGAAQAVVPRSTSGSASAGLTYSLTPQTDFGLDATSTRTSSVIQDLYMSRAMVSLARRIGNRWFMQGRGGPAWVTALRQTYPLPQGTLYAFGGSLGYKTSIQSFMATVDRASSGYLRHGGGIHPVSRRYVPAASPWKSLDDLWQRSAAEYARDDI